jgi:hypothetical protein
LFDLQQQYTKWHVNSWKIAKSFISMQITRYLLG